MEALLKTQQSLNPEKVETLKAFKIKPNIIYVKNGRDQMMMLTEKRDKKVPEDEHGYWGGFSPTRVDKY